MCSQRVRKVQSSQVPVGWGKGKSVVLFFGVGPFVSPGVRPSGQHLDSHKEGAPSQLSASIPPGGVPSLPRSCPLGGGTALATVTTPPIFQGSVFLFPLSIFFMGKTMLFFPGFCFFYFWILLDMLVAKREPTPCYRDASSVGTLNGHAGGIAGKSTVRPRFLPCSSRARHPGPGKRHVTLVSCRLSLLSWVGG